MTPRRWRMTSWLVLAACGAMLAGCTSTGVASGNAVGIGQPFTLHPGGSVRLAAPATTIGLDAVLADSRCPEGEQCVWAGKATVRVWWQRDGGPRETGELHTAANGPSPVRIGDLDLRLLDLTPAPVSGRTIDPARYVATLALARSDAPPTDR